MSEDEDPETEKRLNRTYYLGQSSGLEEAAGILLERAIGLFGIGKDGDVITMRGIATEIKKLSVTRREEADKKFGKS